MYTYTVLQLRSCILRRRIDIARKMHCGRTEFNCIQISHHLQDVFDYRNVPLRMHKVIYTLTDSRNAYNILCKRSIAVIIV